MAKPQVFIAFHAGEPFGATLESARNESAEGVIRGAGPFSSRPEKCLVFPTLGRCASTLGVAVFIAATNDRLLDAFNDPAERKAVFDGVSRLRFVPTPVAGNSCELKLLSPLEVADELRTNFDLWRRALFTAPIARPPQVETRFATKTPDPAAELATFTFKGPTLLVVDVDEIARHGDLDAALARFVAAIKARKDLVLAPAQGQPAGAYEKMLRDILTAGARAEVIELPSPADFDGARHGFPLELARNLAPASLAARALGSGGESIAKRPLSLAGLEPKLARGLLLRRLASSFSSSALVPTTERVRASFTLGAALMDRLVPERADEPCTAADLTLGAEIVTNLERIIDTVNKRAKGDEAENHIVDAKKAKTRAVRALPKLDEEGALPNPPVKRGEFVQALRKVCTAAVQSAGHLTDALKAHVSPNTQVPQHAGKGEPAVAERETAV